MTESKVAPAVGGEHVRDVQLSNVAFATFYELHYADIVRALSITLGDRSLGCEATDEAMVRAFDRWNDVATYNNPAGWVYRVGLNWGRSWHRRANRKMPWSSDQMTLPETPDVALSSAIKGLDIKYRSVVVCRYLLDWSTAQTAEALDIAEGTVKSRLTVGLQRLRDELDEPEASPQTTPQNLHEESTNNEL